MAMGVSIVLRLGYFGENQSGFPRKTTRSTQ
jgi:hypothetical protein